MVIPLYDHNPFKWPVPPYATWGLIAVNAIVFAIEAASPDETVAAMIGMFGTVPAEIFRYSPHPGVLPAEVTLVTSSFLHGGFGHLFGNMLFLFIFGDDIEEVLGPLRFLSFYFLCAIASDLTYAAANPHSLMPTIGASGAVAGVLAAYLLLRPCAKVLIALGWIPIMRVRAYWILGSWIALQVYHVLNKPGEEIAYMAHVGGFVAGGVLFLALKPSWVELFDCIEEPDQTAESYATHGSAIRNQQLGGKCRSP
ncbi:MAG: rhomboid family intramembrane serine protease [Hyphomicrobiales bacterium]|nr:rhomboid family intramembrane serine protease [Hyphomicrobiales bacterium]MBV8823864.1 rhomboid family intramembrane serine protease [Hyphomicrobiales bacterium]MBV9430062.1 rhomboid family intramembrane serine protease [Bradyrhizobiaceae bacterium]